MWRWRPCASRLKCIAGTGPAEHSCVPTSLASVRRVCVTVFDFVLRCVLRYVPCVRKRSRFVGCWTRWIFTQKLPFMSSKFGGLATTSDSRGAVPVVPRTQHGPSAAATVCQDLSVVVGQPLPGYLRPL